MSIFAIRKALEVDKRSLADHSVSSPSTTGRVEPGLSVHVGRHTQTFTEGLKEVRVGPEAVGSRLTVRLDYVVQDSVVPKVWGVEFILSLDR